MLLTNKNLCLGQIPQIALYFYELRDELSEKKTGYIARINALLSLFIIAIARKIENREEVSKTNFGIINRIIKELHNDIGRKWTINELASKSHLQTTAFIERFRLVIGFPPMKYLTHIRIKKAQGLLLDKKSDITSIAYDLGFCSSQHFSSQFKRYTGITPKVYRIRFQV